MTVSAALISRSLSLLDNIWIYILWSDYCFEMLLVKTLRMFQGVWFHLLVFPHGLKQRLPSLKLCRAHSCYAALSWLCSHEYSYYQLQAKRELSRYCRVLCEPQQSMSTMYCTVPHHGVYWSLCASLQEENMCSWKALLFCMCPSLLTGIKGSAV